MHRLWASCTRHLGGRAMSSRMPGAGAAGDGALRYRLASGPALVLSKGDITRWTGNAIVNAANERMLGGGGVDGAIHRAAGPELYEACLKVPEDASGARCPTGQARITPGSRLPAKHVIHTVGPVYSRQSREASAALLSSCYQHSIALAREHRLATVAFPAISCGVYGYPLHEAADVALAALGQACVGEGAPAEVHFVLFDDAAMRAWEAAAERAKLPRLG